jgi:hypothetical protein
MSSIVTFSDRKIDFLFDCVETRTILAYAVTQEVEANTRDNKYHNSYPRRDDHDKGHLISHAQGGFEGGPNYFFQRPSLNGRLSPLGHLWRDIETYLSSESGLFAFVRLIYPPFSDKDIPSEVEYGLITRGNQFRSLIFSNQ